MDVIKSDGFHLAAESCKRKWKIIVKRTKLNEKSKVHLENKTVGKIKRNKSGIKKITILVQNGTKYFK
jgi:hypothetical protein